MPALRVGIDFDNTLICYEQIFSDEAVKKGWLPPSDNPLSKAEVKSELISQDGNDLRWQELQSIVYGTEVILNAPFFAGVIDFFKKIQQYDVELFIVSHKSNYSNFDKTKDLRHWARQWMSQNNITSYIPTENINFEETLPEKVERINSLNFHFFIDDLQKVYDHSTFTKNCNKILFNDPESTSKDVLQFNNWSDISFFLEQQSLFMKEKGFVLNPLRILKREGNNRLFQGSSPENSSLILKSYSNNKEDERKRGVKETKAYNLLEKHGLTNTPKLIFHDSNLNFSCLSYIEGQIGTEVEYQPWMGDKMVEFMLKLNEVYLNDSSSPYEYATDGRNSFADYTTIIERRFAAIREGIEHSNELKTFFLPTINELAEYKVKVFEQFASGASKLSNFMNTPFERSQLTLSPSDFGLHNMKVDQKEVFFLDFEYFGVDDPAKLWADFYHHIGFELAKEERLRLIKRYAASTPCNGFSTRIQLVEPLIQLEWVLIVLNICQKGTLERKLHTNPEEKRQTLINSRLQKARTMLSFLGKSQSIQL
jgi:hypothetical protein